MILCLFLSILLVIMGIRIGVDIFAKYLYDNSKIDQDLYLNAVIKPDFLLEIFKHSIRK